MPTLRSKSLIWEDKRQKRKRLSVQIARQPEERRPRSKSQESAEPEAHTAFQILKSRWSEHPKGKTVLRRPNARANEITLDECLTDPEPGMDSRRATVRNMRSKCRCSCVLQFTFRRAVSCVLHRPPSQVIHCIVLFLSLSLRKELKLEKTAHRFSHPFAGSTGLKPRG